MKRSEIVKKLRPRVVRGAALLDTLMLDWPTREDTSGLDMSDGACCVLGQAYGNFFEGLAHIGLMDTVAVSIRYLSPEQRRLSEHHGFTLKESEASDNGQWCVLTELWIAEIRTRRAAGGSE